MLFDEAEFSGYGCANYENRLVAFFDVLGWRNEIERAGSDSRRIGRLYAITKIFESAVATTPSQFPSVQVTSFSDCVVVSVPYDPTVVQQWIEALGRIQISLALLGFWIRGAVTVGELIHDSISVFGPALNRAYELETRYAIFPRILVDEKVSWETLGLIDLEGGLRFIDPFKIELLKRVAQAAPNPAALQHFNSIAGTALHASPLKISGEIMLLLIFGRLSNALERASEEKVPEKYAWWHARIAPRVSAIDLPSDFKAVFSKIMFGEPA